MKYIIFTDRHGSETGVVFSELIEHSTFKVLNPTSAGFCSVLGDSGDIWTDNFSVSVWGKSTSLNLESKPDDAEIIKKGLKFRV